MHEWQLENGQVKCSEQEMEIVKNENTFMIENNDVSNVHEDGHNGVGAIWYFFLDEI